MDYQRMPMMATNDVGGTGTLNLQHWYQLMRTGKYETFNRTAMGGADSVPYPVEKLKTALNNTDILLLSGSIDAFSMPKDVEHLKSHLPTERTTHILVEDYNHLDYMWAKDVDETVNPKVMEFLINK